MARLGRKKEVTLLVGVWVESQTAEGAQPSATPPNAQDQGLKPGTQSARCWAETGRSSQLPIARSSSTRGSRAAAPGGPHIRARRSPSSLGICGNCPVTVGEDAVSWLRGRGEGAEEGSV